MNYPELTSIENLFQAWSEFRKGKRKRKDVQEFERNLEDNLFALHECLIKKTYRHGSYFAFFVHDPKRRHIHKASVKDRIVHHLLYKYLYELFDKLFIYDSYSCRLEKGTHKAVNRLEKFTRTVSRNYTQPCWALKMDIKKFFASINHQILKRHLKTQIHDKNILWLLDEVIDSFPQGIPLGNLTSQVFANIYMNELDQFMKNQLKVKSYLRYADDFLILSSYSNDANHRINQIREFLQKELKLELHPKKIMLRRLDWGIDFLGYVMLPHYILPRTKTKRRMFKKLTMGIYSNDSNHFNQSLQSYLGYLSLSDSYKLASELKNMVYLGSEFQR